MYLIHNFREKIWLTMGLLSYNATIRSLWSVIKEIGGWIREQIFLCSDSSHSISPQIYLPTFLCPGESYAFNGQVIPYYCGQLPCREIPSANQWLSYGFQCWYLVYWWYAVRRVLFLLILWLARIVIYLLNVKIVGGGVYMCNSTIILNDYVFEPL